MPPLINEDDISRLVHAFYAAIRQDDLLAPIFATKIKDSDWPAHINHITNFWSSILLKTSSFTGNPMRKHLAIKRELTPAHFSHWLMLFQQTAHQELLPEQAEAIHEMAQRISQSLQMGLAFNFEKTGQHDHPFIEYAVQRPKSLDD